MRRFKGNSSDQTTPVDTQNDTTVSRGAEEKWVWSPIKILGILVACLVGLFLFSVPSVLKGTSSDGLWTLADARLLDVKVKPPKKGTSL